MRCAAIVVVLCGCSFGVAAVDGSAVVRRKHVWADAGLTAASIVGCGVAATAWGAPDQFAPTSGDSTSWRSPQDRFNLQSAGLMWTTPLCAVAAVLLASTIYGQVTAPEDAELDSAIAAGLGGMAAGISAVRTVTPAVSTSVVKAACTSDFGCSVGSVCVKRKYTNEGTCMLSVDASGFPEYEPPELKSVEPNLDTEDCATDGCPAGFVCDSSTGACTK